MQKYSALVHVYPAPHLKRIQYIECCAESTLAGALLLTGFLAFVFVLGFGSIFGIFFSVLVQLLVDHAGRLCDVVRVLEPRLRKNGIWIYDDESGHHSTVTGLQNNVGFISLSIFWAWYWRIKPDVKAKAALSRLGRSTACHVQSGVPLLQTGGVLIPKTTVLRASRVNLECCQHSHA